MSSIRSHRSTRRCCGPGPICGDISPSGPLVDGLERMEAVDRTVHITDDPEVVIGEFRYVGSAHGRPFDRPCIFVMRVRNGEIVESRDYSDHVGLARAFGRVEDFAARLTAGAGA